MNLLIDIGNSLVKYLYESDGHLSEVKLLRHEELDQIFISSTFRKTTKIVFASVADNKVAKELLQLAKKAGINIYQVTSERKRGTLINAYPEYHRLGVDRWLALVAAITHYPQKNCLIIDAGTATTLDLLSANGEHLGGWIIAGIELMQQSLLTKTAKIKGQNLSVGNLSFASNTADNIKHGSLASTIGTIHLAIKQADNNLFSLDKVILTGGNAALIAQYVSVPIVVDEKFVFKGLQQYI